MDVDHSHDHIAFNVINVDEDSLDSDNEKEDESEMMIDHNTLLNEIIINEPRPSRMIVLAAKVDLLKGLGNCQ
jgi:hypothetical protein